MTALMSAQQQREVQTGKKGPTPPGQRDRGDGAKRTGASSAGKGTKQGQGKPGGRPSRGTNPRTGGAKRPPGKAAGGGKGTKPPGRKPKS
jgi:hypothetical protein